MTVQNANITPMMVQFLDIKAGYQDALLFYRMGDFYELFFDDAVQAAAALDIALTKRGKHLGEDIPMCGVPAHSAEGYLLSLIRKGFRVAVCEQLESPIEAKKRGAKSVVKRDVVRLVTPGTLTEDTLLDARRHNYLASFAEIRNQFAFAWVDVSTGDLKVTLCGRNDISSLIGRLSPRELLLSESGDDFFRDAAEDADVSVTELVRGSFDSTAAKRRVCDAFGVKSLDGFAAFKLAEVSALGAIIDYLELTQKGKLPLLKTPTREIADHSMQLDAATRRNLELMRTTSGSRQGSLVSCIDRTITAPGARLLEQRLSAPSTEVSFISATLDAVEHFLADPNTRNEVRTHFRHVPDIERALSRLSLDRAGPRDLAVIRNGLKRGHEVATALGSVDLPNAVQNSHSDLGQNSEISAFLTAELIEEPGSFIRDGGFIAAGRNAELDEVRSLRDDGRSVVAGLQAEYAKLSDISALKIKHNNVLGYFIETTATHAEKMLAAPLSHTFIHRQTTANAVRFTTTDLSALETKILNAGNRALEIEKALFQGLRSAVLETSATVSAAAQALAEIDLFTSLSTLASDENWVRPLVDSSREFNICGGRHPVVEQALKGNAATPFVANDCNLSASDDAANIWLLTGPNMAGKSTFLRQNALIALLAQIGSFVPAASAHIGIVTQLFSRVGASDDLARGRSTFMVEMVETAAILNQAKPGALVILDEIGRGTATYDGLSIAWATLEHLHDVNRSRTLFATHYHELTALAGRLPYLTNATVAVREWEGEVVFLHEVHEGSADRSYGVQVAKLAGLPSSVLARAKSVLERLEKGERGGNPKAQELLDDLPLFNAPVVLEQSPATEGRLLMTAFVEGINPDELSPKDALATLYELKALVDKG